MGDTKYFFLLKERNPKKKSRIYTLKSIKQVPFCIVNVVSHTFYLRVTFFLFELINKLIQVLIPLISIILINSFK